jgi:hypothetical protein
MILAGRAGDTPEQAVERLAARFLKGAQKSTVLPPPAGQEYVNVCANLCGADARCAKLQNCAACRVVNYCGKVCQKADWKRHKAECKARSEVKQLAAEGGVMSFDTVPEERARRLVPEAAVAVAGGGAPETGLSAAATGGGAAPSGDA